jgi:signal peptidase I
MTYKNVWKKIKKGWKWIWNSNSVLSWVVALLIIFIVVKFVFFPVLSLIMGTSLPLAGVESSSMDHQIVREDFGQLALCGRTFSEHKPVNFDGYWAVCGEWYEKEKNISKEMFEDFPLHNGFQKGDIIVVWGRFKPEVGDVIIFKPNLESTAPRPIIHRIVEINNSILQTKGDHNEKQLSGNNNLFRTDETRIEQEQIIGKAVFKIPWLGWVKIWITDFLKMLIP